MTTLPFALIGKPKFAKYEIRVINIMGALHFEHHREIVRILFFNAKATLGIMIKHVLALQKVAMHTLHVW